jgi:hypothetical protein
MCEVTNYKSVTILVLSLLTISCGGGGGGGSDPGAPAAPTENLVPTANAGQDQSVEVGSGIVTLDGSNSSDPEGSVLSYQWEQTEGDPVNLTDVNTATPSFNTSNVVGVFTFSLVVTDDAGQSSQADTVVITVTAPVAVPRVTHSTFLDVTGYESSIREMAYDSQGNIVFVGTMTLPGHQLTSYPGLNSSQYHVIGNNIVSSNDAAPGNNGGDGNLVVGKISSDLTTLLWRTVIGGSGKERGYGVRLDANDNIYIAGRTSSADFPVTPGAFDTTYNGGTASPGGHHGPGDAFALKLSADGATLLYATYLGGSGEDSARGGLAIDNQGHAYVCGSTEDSLNRGFLSYPSSDPQNANAGNFINSPFGGHTDGFIAKLSTDGSQVVYTRLLGSSDDPTGEELAVACEVDSTGQIHAVGMVWGSDAFTTADAYQRTFGGVSDVYYIRLSNDGTNVHYATMYGGSSGDYAEHGRLLSINENEVLFSGETESQDLPMTASAEAQADPNYRPFFNGGATDGFIVKLNVSTGQPVFSSYIGGSASSESVFSALQPDGSMIATGRTGSTDFYVTANAQQFNHGGGAEEAWYREFSPAGVLLYSSYFGGSGDIDYGRFIVPTPQGGALLSIKTSSADALITPQALNPNISTNGLNGEDVMLTVFD